MWVFLSNAFLSIVEDKDDLNTLMVRARLRGDLERVFPGEEVIETPPPADYRFRARIDRWTVAERMKAAVIGIDYTNFKKSVTDQARHDAYLRVWNDMWLAQEDSLMPPRFPGDTMVATVKSGRVTTQWDPRTGEILPATARKTLAEKKAINRRGKKSRRPRSSRR